MKIHRPRPLGSRGRVATRGLAAGLAIVPMFSPAARAAWSAPVTVATGATSLLAPGVAWTTTGHGVLGWRTGSYSDVALATAAPATDRFVSRGVYRPAQRVDAGGNGNFAAFGTSGLVLGGVTRYGNRMAVALGHAGVSRGRRVTVGPMLPSGPTRLAANTTGDIALVGLTHARAADFRTLVPMLVVRRHGRFGHPIRLAGGSRRYSGAFDVAINQRGDVLVAWQRHGTVYARINTAGGRLRRAVRVGHNGNAQISAWLAADRSATVAWEARDLNATEVRAARALPGGRFVRGARLLERFDGHIAATACAGPAHDRRLVRVSGGRAGQPVVAWTARESGHLVVRAAIGTGTKNFRATPLAYSPTLNSCIDAMAVNRDGTATILWSQSTPRSRAAELLVATQSSPGSAYPTPTTVAQDATPGAALTIDPITHKLVATWVAVGEDVRVSTSDAGAG